MNLTLSVVITKTKQHLLSVPLVNVTQFRTSQEARANQIKRGCTAYFLFPESVSKGKGR